MKVIDLLNKIAKGEEVPKNFIYDDYYWSWCEPCKIFESVDELGGIFNLYKYLTTEGNLNDDIEIIDDEEPKKIEPFTKEEMEIYSNTPAYIEDLVHKVNLLIDVVNEMREEEQ